MILSFINEDSQIDETINTYSYSLYVWRLHQC